MSHPRIPSQQAKISPSVSFFAVATAILLSCSSSSAAEEEGWQKVRKLQRSGGSGNSFKPRSLEERFASRRENLNARWAGKVSQTTLHERMLTPTPRDLRHGGGTSDESGVTSRRLARNRALLGVPPVEGDERHLLVTELGDNLVAPFDETAAKASEGNRVTRDNMDRPMASSLPWGDGPGALPGVPRSESGYFKGDGFPQEMWEAVACPVAVRALGVLSSYD